ncbi:Ribosomal protein L23/L15e family protein [Hibiscus syriacus]|uniref:Ribosomal protein L23/L15e family protein n=1 Tax=Hibiscus syriacus TaxID=106335 RepID=A0A6A2ZQ36_HIBSY|nr:uncharacterized protein LOC120140803 isoform X2 [Hibiscus syriacus]KAE8693998.1 Ribosomal protein L23/L15e family protein [Hibiscus syriacus]
MMFGGGGKGMRWGAGGTNMLRAIAGRAAVYKNPTATLQEPLSSSTSSATRRHNNSNTNGYLYVSSSSGSSSLGSYNSNSGVPITANSGSPSPAFSGPPCFDDFEWVPRHEGDNQQPRDFVLGPVPSVAEVQNAVSALQRVAGVSSSRELIRDKLSYNADKEIGDQFPSPDASSMHRVRSAGSELDWIEPSMQLYDARAFHPCVTNDIFDAFHLLQTDPTVQEMVTSFSSDEAVWNAVLNNEMVRELRRSYYAAPEDSSSMSFDGSSDENFDKSSETTSTVKWIFDNTKAKMLELFDKITKLVNELFQVPPDDWTTKTADLFDERLRISIVLSVIVLLIVVVTRAQTT